MQDQFNFLHVVALGHKSGRILKGTIKGIFHLIGITPISMRSSIGRIESQKRTAKIAIDLKPTNGRVW